MYNIEKEKKIPLTTINIKTRNSTRTMGGVQNIALRGMVEVTY